MVVHGDRNGAQERTKISFGRTMMQALELLQLAKRHVSGRSNIDVTIAIIELRFSVGIC